MGANQSSQTVEEQLVEEQLMQQFQQGMQEGYARLAERRTFDLQPIEAAPAQVRARLLGLPEMTCQRVAFTPEICSNPADPMTLEKFEAGDMVWRAEKDNLQTCFGPDVGEPYRPAYYKLPDGRDVDVMMNPYAPGFRLEPDCFRRQRNVRQRRT